MGRLRSTGAGAVLALSLLMVTGRSRESLMALVVSSLRAVLIVSVATTLTFGSSNLYRTLTDGMPREIMQVVTGDDDAPADKIDQSLDQMAAAMIGIDTLSAIGSQGLKDRGCFSQTLGCWRHVALLRRRSRSKLVKESPGQNAANRRWRHPPN